MTGSSMKRIRLAVLNTFPFLLFIRCSVLWLQFVPVCLCTCATQDTGQFLSAANQKLTCCHSLQPVWKPAGKANEGMDIPALGKQVLFRWKKVLSSDDHICRNTSPSLALHLQENTKNSVLLYSVQASLSNSDNSPVFYRVSMCNSSVLSSEVMNCLSLIYSTMIFLWH